MTAKKLIEVAMPIREISTESVRDKSIRHGHISTLHLWWARRPLPVCRAIVFASLVPDPKDPNCPQAFREAVTLLLGKESNIKDPYKPYPDIPWTPVLDPMDDDPALPRERLMMFIGKFSDDAADALLYRKAMPATGKQIHDACLIKWENRNNETIINKARQLIWVAHNAHTGKDALTLLAEFDVCFKNIKKTEKLLYTIADRHQNTEGVAMAEKNLADAIEAFLDKMPRVFDPFAGGGAIPLEAARLGCRSYGNDINPVAHIIQKGSLEFPQRFGKPITYSKSAFIERYGEAEWRNLKQEDLIVEQGEATAVSLPNRLSFDVAFYAKKLLALAEADIGHFYPKNTKGVKPIAYYWARVGTCSNPSCRAEVPLLRSFYLVNTKSKQIYLKPTINDKHISFEIVKGAYDESKMLGWLKSANLTCPCCGSFTDVKSLRKQFIDGKSKEQLLAVIIEGENDKQYRLPVSEELEILHKLPHDIDRPLEKLPLEHTGKFPRPWGLDTWGDLFSNRQLLTLNTLVEKLNLIKQTELDPSVSDYNKALVTYLAILIDRGSSISTSMGRWDISRENIQSPFSKQAIAMVFDYPEGNLLGKTTGSLNNQLDWIVRYIDSESNNPFNSVCINSSSGEREQFANKYLTAVVTDPPYYDAIPYADLSDFFYVWLKRTLGDVYMLNFATPQTPKSDECTALKHHHSENKEKAKQHFETKLMQIFDAIEHQTSDIVSIMFAHQSTEAWTTLCNSVISSRMNITGSWAIDTEMANRSLGLSNAVLESSVTVACRPTIQEGYGSFRDIKKEIEQTVEIEVEKLYGLGLRGADLLTACFGQAVSVFGKYKSVEKADGSTVSVKELLEIARESAFNALLKGFNGDDFTKFYIGWLQLYGFAESDFDDAAKFSRVGLSINVDLLFKEHIFTKNGNKQTLGSYNERLLADKKCGELRSDNIIDQVHRAMWLWKSDRKSLLRHISQVGGDTPESGVWRVITSLCEVLPTGSDDRKQAEELLANRDNLIKESKNIGSTNTANQTQLDF